MRLLGVVNSDVTAEDFSCSRVLSELRRNREREERETNKVIHAGLRWP